MYSSNTAQALVQVRGPTITYANLKFLPTVDTRAHSIEIKGFTYRRGSEVFDFDNLPVSRVLPTSAMDDILFHTFEADEEVRSTYLELDFEIPEYDEVVRNHFRVAERVDYPDLLFYEVEDSSGDWIAVEDINLTDLLPDEFVRIMELSVAEQFNSHTLHMLPMDTE